MRDVTGLVPFRGGGFAPRNLPLAGAVTLLGLVALWQLGDSLGLIPTLFLPSPANIAVALYHLTVSGELWKHLSASLARLAIGWVIGHRVRHRARRSRSDCRRCCARRGWRWSRRCFRFRRSRWCRCSSSGSASARDRRSPHWRSGVFFPTVIATAGGVDNVPRSLIRMAQSFGLSHVGDRAQGGAAGRIAGDPQRLPRRPRRSPSCCWSRRR